MQRPPQQRPAQQRPQDGKPADAAQNGQPSSGSVVPPLNRYIAERGVNQALAKVNPVSRPRPTEGPLLLASPAGLTPGTLERTQTARDLQHASAQLG